MASGHVAALVLAAGRSSRMGAHKLVLPLGERPVLAHAVAAVEGTRATPFGLVLGHEATRLTTALLTTALPRAGWQPIYNAAYAEGMASSLRAGIRWLGTLEEEQPVIGALIVLGDQPLLTTAHLERLLRAAEREPDYIHAAVYGEQRGTPVYFPRAYFAELLALRGDAGGRSVLRRHAERVRLVVIEPPEVGLDVDTPEDYARVSAYWAAHFATGTS
jgi:molybdenum cofactor cytidylyltransferase